jgi:cytochrome c oxidase cbb3-type subunit 4
MIGILRGVLTLALMLLFIRFVLWAWSAKRKDAFDSMARMPLEDDTDPKSGRGRP